MEDNHCELWGWCEVENDVISDESILTQVSNASLSLANFVSWEYYGFTKQDNVAFSVNELVEM